MQFLGFFFFFFLSGLWCLIHSEISNSLREQLFRSSSLSQPMRLCWLEIWSEPNKISFVDPQRNPKTVHFKPKRSETQNDRKIIRIFMKLWKKFYNYIYNINVIFYGEKKAPLYIQIYSFLQQKQYSRHSSEKSF